MVFEYVIAALIVAVYIWLIVFAIRGGNMTIGFLLAGCMWTILVLFAFKSGFLNPDFAAANSALVDKPVMTILNELFQTGLRGQGGLIVDIVFGAWFGAVLMETGIAATLVRKTVELGGDKPVVVATLLSIIVAGMFTSIFGIGAVIGIGVIVFPILLSLGIPKVVAACSYLFSVAAGLYMNPTLGIGTFNTYTVDEAGNALYTFQEYSGAFGWIACIISVAYVAAMTFITVKKSTAVKAWAAPVDDVVVDEKKVPGIALILPFMPTITILIFKTENIPTFLLWGFVALFLCGRGKGIKMLGDNYSKTLYTGIVDSASLIAFLIMLAMVTKSIGNARPFISLVLEPVIPQNQPLILAIAVAILAPAALFRGPLTMFGTAGPIYLTLAGFGYPHSFLFPLFWIPSITINVAACVTQSYVAWGISYAKIDTREWLKYSVVKAWILSAALSIVCYFVVGGY